MEGAIKPVPLPKPARILGSLRRGLGLQQGGGVDRGAGIEFPCASLL